MQHGDQIRLSSAEISNLWNTYMNDSMLLCIMTHFGETVTDPEVEQLIDQAKEITINHLTAIKAVFMAEGIAVPLAFPVEKHVNHGGPKLFSDVFYLEHIRHVCKFALSSHASAIGTSARRDIRELFAEFFEHARTLNDEVIVVMEKKGVYIRTPFMNYPNEVDYIEEQSFIKGWFGRKRPLLAVEVTHLTVNAVHNVMGKSLCLGFAQVTKDEEVRNYFLRGKKNCAKIVETIHQALQESDVPSTMTWDYSITESTTPPFSEQLMMFIVGGLSNLGVSTYGMGMSMSLRRDLGLMYSEFIRVASSYGEDGMQIMIERKWMEQPPQFTDRERLVKEK